MRIEIKVRHRDLDEQLEYLKHQMSYYGSSEISGGVKVWHGDRFNLYIHPHKHALMPETYRLVEIMPKDTPL